MVPNVELPQVKDLGRLCRAWLKKQDFRIPQLILSDGHLPFIGLTEKIAFLEDETTQLANGASLRLEAASTDYKHMSLVLQERLNALSDATRKAPSDLVDLLVQADLYDMAFTVVLKFWRGSALERELEKIFENMAIKCFPPKGMPWTSNPAVQGSKLAGDWEILVVYLKRYKDIHARLPVTVASTLLQADSCIEMPLWRVQMFKVTSC
ncbi:hypothetical protein DY000_02053053 [Brassica cretica]|uniref:Uncharacterized protein n=1 Tax=Brassica cretica TaxID=69181 RepID=A0ABQ7AE69_BRACR|nr:hypothetical protein DY000_02053053 [Brassica cretica]